MEAYRKLPIVADWQYFEGVTQVVTDAAQTTGTIAYSQSSRELTLTGATWPATAQYGAVVIADVRYPIERRVSDAIVVLDTTQNPGEDVAASTSYQYQRYRYLLPPDVTDIKELLDTTLTSSLRRVPTRDVFWRSESQLNTSAPTGWAMFPSQDTPGRWELWISSASATVRQLRILYNARFTTLNNFHTTSDTVVPTTVSITNDVATFSASVLTENHVGNVLRVGTSTSEPTSLAGSHEDSDDGNLDSPPEFERLVVAVNSGTEAILSAPVLSAVSTRGYMMSSLIDVNYDGMRDYFLRLCEECYYRFTSDGSEASTTRSQLASVASFEALRTAMIADSKEIGKSGVTLPWNEGVTITGASAATESSYVIPTLSGWAVEGATFTRNGSSFDLTFDRTKYKPTTTQDYYVSYPGFGTKDGLSWANAKSLIRTAVDAANTAGVVPRIFLDGGQDHQNDASMAPSMQLIGVNRGAGSNATLSSPTFVTNSSYATNIYCENLIFNTAVTSSAGTRYFKNCSFNNTVSGADASQFDGDGIVILEDCVTSNGDGDGFDYSGTLSAFEINCTAQANGDGVTVADNGSTAQGDVRIVRYGGTYTDGYRNIHDTGDVKSFLIDCTVNTSQSLSGGVAYDSFNVGCGETGSTDTTEVTIWSGNVSGGAVVDLFNDSDGTLTVYDLATYATSAGTIATASIS
jgi:hypothetical protein